MLLPYQSNNAGKEGLIIVVILLVVFVIAFLWLNLVSEPQEKKEKEKWISENQPLLDIQKDFNILIKEIGSCLPKCSKCDGIYYHLWNVSDRVEIRCETCKKKKFIDINGDYFYELLNRYIDFVDIVPSLKNPKIISYLKNFFDYDFYSMRINTPYVRAIKFSVNRELVIENKRNPKVDRSRRISQKVKNEVWKRDEGKCVECGSNKKLEFDHIIPFSKGGANTYRNIQLLCENCNRSKSDKI
jgi:hypothetical protein